MRSLVQRNKKGSLTNVAVVGKLEGGGWGVELHSFGVYHLIKCCYTLLYSENFAFEEKGRELLMNFWLGALSLRNGHKINKL